MATDRNFRVELVTSASLLGDQKALSAVRNLCEQTQFKNENIGKNYRSAGWRENYDSLANVLIQQKRFDPPRGQFHLLFDGPELIGFAGATHHDQETLICLTRAIIRPDFRNRQLLGEHILPHQIAFAKANGYQRVWLTFNEYNKSIYFALSRIAENKAIKFGLPNVDIYKNFVPLPDTQMIRGVAQHVMELCW